MSDHRNAHAIGIHSIDHFALNVPSIADAKFFFEKFGLDVSAVDDNLDIRAADGHRWARMLPAAHKSLAYLSLNCFAEDLAAIEKMVRDQGGIFDVSSAHKNADGFWFHDPDGNLLQVRVGPKTTPTEKTPVSNRKVPANSRGSCMRSQLATVRPRRMSHVLMFSPDVMRAVEFYEKGLGLRLSDHSGDGIAFTHAPHGSDHHLVAFGKGEAKGWHHVAWDVASIDEVGVGATQMANAGYKEGWGTGRHVLGSNYFHYVRDPWGSFSEYSADIDFLSGEVKWPAGDFLPEDSLYQWGPDLPAYFLENTDGR